MPRRGTCASEASVRINNAETRERSEHISLKGEERERSRAYVVDELNARAKRAYLIDELNLRSSCTHSLLVPLPLSLARRSLTRIAYTLSFDLHSLCITLHSLSPCSSPVNLRSSQIYSHARSLRLQMWGAAYTVDSVGVPSFIYGKVFGGYTPKGSLGA